MKKSYQIVSKVILIALIISIQGVLFSQNANRPEGSKKGDKLTYQWYVNLNGGFMHSYCDIQSGKWQGSQFVQGFGEENHQGYGFGLRIGKHISPVFGLYGSVITGQLKGRSGVDTKNLAFETDITIDAILGVTVSFTNLIFGYKPRLVNIYGTTGIGLSHFSSEAYLQEPWGDPIPSGRYSDTTAWSNTNEGLVPLGIGIDFRISDHWDINFESTIRLFDSDKLDGIIAGEKNDAYYYTSLGLGYSFGKSKGPKMQIETEPSILAVHGDSIPIEIRGTFPESYNKKAVVDFTPVLKYGDQSLVLETMYFQGEEVAEEYQKPGAVIIPATGGSFTYKTKVKYEPGMDICELYVDPMASIKGKTPFSMHDRKIADGLIMTSRKVENTEQLLLADHGFRRDIIVSEMGFIYYIVNKHNLNLNYRLNKDENSKEMLAKMNDFIAKGWEFRNIEISAWASPEGEE
ncbi:MAG: porin family protein, partial [Bacteroidales bacterium]|nr:porin family protein [Bacteroidales bacterium]